MIGATVDQGDFDRGEWMPASAYRQISELTVGGCEGRRGSPDAVLGAMRAAESGAKARPSFESAGVTLRPSSPSSNHPNLNHNHPRCPTSNNSSPINGPLWMSQPCLLRLAPNRLISKV